MFINTAPKKANSVCFKGQRDFRWMEGASWQLISSMYHLHNVAYWKHVPNNWPACHFQCIRLISRLSKQSDSSHLACTWTTTSGFYLRQRNNGSSRTKHLLLSCVHSRHVAHTKFFFFFKNQIFKLACTYLSLPRRTRHAHTTKKHNRTQSHLHTGNKLSR